MNKYIEYDIHNGITLLKCAIMNILNALNDMEIDSYTFGSDISMNLVIRCMYESGWTEVDGVWYSISKRDFVFTDDVNLTLELRSNEN